jgi:TetR/AcrR family transcriptional regulator, transcriptional repressor of aconitase
MYAHRVPKVSQAYLDARRAQILDAARRCFVRNGFHETSMQDVFAESKLSAGAVYRYFSSKDDMILAIVEENMHDVMAMIHSLAANPHGDGLGEALASVLDVLRDKHAGDDMGTMAVLVWSEQLRNPALRRRFEAFLDEMRVALAEVVRGHQADGTLPPGADPEALAGLLMTIIPGFILQLALFGAGSDGGIPQAARALWPAAAATAGKG